MSETAASARESTAASSATSKLEGYVKPGYESVQTLLQTFLDNGQEFESSLCVYVGEEIVVNLAGKSSYHSASEFNSQHYKRDSLQLIFSASQPIISLCLATLVDKKLIESYDDKGLFAFSDRQRE